MPVSTAAARRPGSPTAALAVLSVLLPALVWAGSLRALPQALISRAREIMAKLEVNNVNGQTIGKNILGGEKEDKQISLMEYGAVDFAQEVANLDMDSLSPREALNLLYVLREKARKI